MEVGVMPKEYLVTEATRRRTDEQGGPTEAIRVGWDRYNGWVQIATVEMAGSDGAVEKTEGTLDQGQFVDLDRHTLNDLIRVLRRARDAAYGRDE
jgi:hypothetical protein